MATINEVICGQAPVQIYQLVSDIAPPELAASLQEQNGELFYLDGAEMQSKTELMQELATQLNFPDYFGGNWDALADCWSDVGWLEPDSTHCVLLFDRWEKCASQTLIETLQTAVASWIATADRVYVLLRTTTPDQYIQQLPVIAWIRSLFKRAIWSDQDLALFTKQPLFQVQVTLDLDS